MFKTYQETNKIELQLRTGTTPPNHWFHDWNYDHYTWEIPKNILLKQFRANLVTSNCSGGRYTNSYLIFLKNAITCKLCAWMPNTEIIFLHWENDNDNPEEKYHTFFPPVHHFQLKNTTHFFSLFANHENILDKCIFKKYYDQFYSADLILLRKGEVQTSQPLMFLSIMGRRVFNSRFKSLEFKIDSFWQDHAQVNEVEISSFCFIQKVWHTDTKPKQN